MSNDRRGFMKLIFCAGGYKPAELMTTPSPLLEEHQPSCFALEEEKGECWRGSGSTKPPINEARPSL